MNTVVLGLFNAKNPSLAHTRTCSTPVSRVVPGGLALGASRTVRRRFRSSCASRTRRYTSVSCRGWDFA